MGNRPSKQRVIEFALHLEKNEERMAENAAMAVTCDQYGIDIEVGYDWLISLSDGPWWLDDKRLTPAEREKLCKEYEAREKADV